MTQEQKQLLLKDICTRLPYGVWVECCDVSGKLDNIWLTHFYNGGNTVVDVNGNTDFFHDNDYFDITKIKPYLRPMSSMTKSEWEEYKKAVMTDNNIHTGCVVDGKPKIFTVSVRGMDFLNVHYFDYRDLIQMGLALEAPEGMYSF